MSRAFVQSMFPGVETVDLLGEITSTGEQQTAGFHPEMELAFAIRRHFHRVTRVDAHPTQEVPQMKELVSRQGLDLSGGGSGGIGFLPGNPLHESWHFV